MQCRDSIRIVASQEGLKSAVVCIGLFLLPVRCRESRIPVFHADLNHFTRKPDVVFVIRSSWFSGENLRLAVNGIKYSQRYALALPAVPVPEERLLSGSVIPEIAVMESGIVPVS